MVKKAFAESISSFALIASALLSVGGGSTFILSAVVKCAAVNFPELRGFATSIPMAAFGLSAFVLAQVSAVICPGDTYGLLRILTYLPVVTLFFCFFFVKFVSQPYASLQGDNSPRDLRSNIEMVDPTRQPRFDTHNNTKSATELQGRQLFRSSLFWYHFLIMGLLAGIGQMYIYSCGYVVKALLGSDHSHVSDGANAMEDAKAFLAQVQNTQSFHVGIISLSSFTGRLCSGSFSDILVNKLRMQRDWMLIVAGTFAFIAQACGLLVTSSIHLWIISVCTGLMYGMCIGAYPMIIGDAFGMKNFSQNWGILALSPIPTAYAFNLLFGRIYDRNSIITDQGSRECALGNKCYSEAFKVTLASSVFVLFLACHVIFRHRHKRLP